MNLILVVRYAVQENSFSLEILSRLVAVWEVYRFSDSSFAVTIEV